MSEEKKAPARKTTSKTTTTAKKTPAKPKTAGTTRKPPASGKTSAAKSSKQSTPMVVKIDGKDYPVDALSDQAKAQITNLRATDRHIEELEAELAIARTARGSYAAALERELKQLDNKTLQ